MKELMGRNAEESSERGDRTDSLGGSLILRSPG